MPVGETATISAFVEDGSAMAKLEVVLHLAADSSEVAVVALYDDGATGGDEVAGDRRFTGQYTPDTPVDMLISMRGSDDKGNAREDLYQREVTSVQFAQAARVLVVEEHKTPSYANQVGGSEGILLQESLGRVGLASDRWRRHVRGLPSLEMLSSYDVVLWTAGRFGIDYDLEVLDVIERYLASGGRLAVFGQTIGSWLTGTDVRRAFAADVLRIQSVQHNAGLYGVLGAMAEWDGFAADLLVQGWFSNKIDAVNGAEVFLVFDPSAIAPPVHASASPAAGTYSDAARDHSYAQPVEQREA